MVRALVNDRRFKTVNGAGPSETGESAMIQLIEKMLS